MVDGNETEVSLDNFVEDFYAIMTAENFESLENSIF